MHGFNKAFMADPGEFLTKQPLRVQGRDELPSETWPLAVKTPPIHLFDLKLVGKHVELIPFTAHASGNPFARQRPIKAYWLDYFPTKTVIIAGDMGLADFLFTPMLSGCYIGGNATGMVHVAGDVKREAVKGAPAAALSRQYGDAPAGHECDRPTADRFRLQSRDRGRNDDAGGRAQERGVDVLCPGT